MQNKMLYASYKEMIDFKKKEGYKIVKIMESKKEGNQVYLLQKGIEYIICDC